jgi:hypothetical protein
MAKAKNGINGAITGRVGNLVFYELNGENVVRGIGVRTAKLSVAQTANCNNMLALMRFFKTTKAFLRVGFAKEAKGTTRNFHNIATAYNKMHALIQQDGKPAIDYSKVLLSRGTALEPENAMVEATEIGLKFSWDFDETANWSSKNDQVMLMAYFPEVDEAIYVTHGARREALEDTLKIHTSYLTKRMEVYISFVSDGRENVSSSVYLGRINGAL